MVLRLAFSFTVSAAVACGLADATAIKASATASTRMSSRMSAAAALLADARLSPVQKVVRLLGEMRAQLEADMDADQKVFDKMVCWCKTNNAEKKKAIKESNAKMDELTAEIEARAGQAGALKVEVPSIKKEIAESAKALLDAEKIREEEAKAFHETEKATVVGITNLKNAVAVLKKHHELVQVSSGEQAAALRTAMQTALRDIAVQHRDLAIAGGLQQTRVAALRQRTSFLQAGTLSGAALTFYNALTLKSGHAHEQQLGARFAHKLVASYALVQESAVASASSPHLGAYAPASGQIFGILQAMLEDFQATMEQNKKDEATAGQQFQELKASKNAALKAAREMLSDKKKAAAENKAALADAKEDLAATQAQRSADVKFLSNLKLQCNDLDAQMAARTAARQAELSAVGEAVGVLTSDDNREALAKTTSFVQVRAATGTGATLKKRARALRALLGAQARDDVDGKDLLNEWEANAGGIRLTNPFMDADSYAAKLKSQQKQQLAALAVSVSLDSFDKVKKAMDELVAQLKQEKVADVEHKGFCDKEFRSSDKNLQKAQNNNSDLDALIASLDAQLEGLRGEIAEASAAVATNQLEIKKAGQEREEENRAFQQTVRDERATQDILTKALAKLKAFYGKNAALLQQQQAQSQVQTPPVAFEPLHANAGSSPVLALIEKVVQDSVDTEKEATADEVSAQAHYETFVKDATAAVDSLRELIAQKGDAAATKASDRAAAASDLSESQTEHETLSAYRQDLHGQCDFIRAQFGARAEARENEIEAIGEAKGILAGAH